MPQGQHLFDLRGTVDHAWEWNVPDENKSVDRPWDRLMEQLRPKPRLIRGTSRDPTMLDRTQGQAEQFHAERDRCTN